MENLGAGQWWQPLTTGAWVEWQYVEDSSKAIQDLKQQGYTIVAIEQTTESKPLQTFSPQQQHKYCLVFGNEVDGVREEVIQQADIALEIPQTGTKHSLNISVCLGIVAWEFFRKLKL